MKRVLTAALLMLSGGMLVIATQRGWITTAGVLVLSVVSVLLDRIIEDDA